MSYVPDLNAFGMLSELGKTITSGIKEYKQQQLLSALGQDLMSGDYGSAAQKALGAGDMGTGLKLLELGQQKQQAAALPALLGGLPGQGGGGAQAQGDGGGDYFKKLAAVESGGNPNATSPTGAKGTFQFIPSTWAQYGGGADIRDPQAQMAAVQKLTADNRAALMQALGREPSAGELYLAHQQGAGGAIKLLSNPGATPAQLGLGRAVAVNGGNPDAPAGQFVQKWTSKFDRISSPYGFAARDQAALPTAVANAQPRPAAQVAAADSEDDAPTAQAQPVQLPQNGRASADDNTEKLDQLRAYQSRLTSTLATVSGEGPRAAINARLTQVQKMIDDIRPDKDKFQLFQNEDGSLLAVNKTDPTQTQIIQTGRKPKSQAEYDTRKTLADDMSLTGTARTAFLANGKLPDQSRVLRPGDQLVDPTGQVTARNEGGANATISDDNADFLAERVLAGDKQALVGLGRGAQGANNLAKVQGLVAQKAQERGLSAKDILANSAEAQGLNAQQRTFGTQTARMSTSSVEAQGAIALGRQASALVPRGNWVPVNKAIQAFQANTSSPELGKFAAANLAIVNTYARAINPNGQPTVADKEHAREMLNTAMGPDQYNAVLDQMQQEIDMAHNSPSIAKRGLENIRKGKAFMDGIGQNDIFSHGGSGSEAPAKAAAPTNGGTTKSGVKWSIE